MRSYIQQRIHCGVCGIYDRRLFAAPPVIACDKCHDPAVLMFECQGKTSTLEVPWRGTPMKPELFFNGQHTQTASSKGGRKQRGSTGRPKRVLQDPGAIHRYARKAEVANGWTN